MINIFYKYKDRLNKYINLKHSINFNDSLYEDRKYQAEIFRDILIDKESSLNRYVSISSLLLEEYQKLLKSSKGYRIQYEEKYIEMICAKTKDYDKLIEKQRRIFTKLQSDIFSQYSDIVNRIFQKYHTYEVEEINFENIDDSISKLSRKIYVAELLMKVLSVISEYPQYRLVEKQLQNELKSILKSENRYSIVQEKGYFVNLSKELSNLSIGIIEIKNLIGCMTPEYLEYDSQIHAKALQYSTPLFTDNLGLNQVSVEALNVNLLLNDIKESLSVFSFKQEQERLAKLEQERLAKLEIQRLAKLERQRLAKLEKERLAKLEQERLAKLEQELLAKLEQERLAKLEQERLAKLEQERLAKIEQERLAKIEQERLAKIEQERLAKIEQERLAKLEQERLAKIEQERLAKQKEYRLSIIRLNLKKVATIFLKIGVTIIILYVINHFTTNISIPINDGRAISGYDKQIIHKTKADVYNSQELIDIGNQKWLKENINVSTFRNGDSIYHAKTKKDWINYNLKRLPAYCFYQFDSLNNKLYGRFYNWYAVTDPRGITPLGYHVPSFEEWDKLIDYFAKIDQLNNDTTKIKAMTNQLKYFKKLGGLCDNYGYFLNQSILGCYWSKSEYDSLNSYVTFINKENKFIRIFSYKNYGTHIRAIKDL
jgi:uncharacterized protein (TIGR02145 family)